MRRRRRHARRGSVSLMEEGAEGGQGEGRDWAGSMWGSRQEPKVIDGAEEDRNHATETKGQKDKLGQSPSERYRHIADLCLLTLTLQSEDERQPGACPCPDCAWHPGPQGLAAALLARTLWALGMLEEIQAEPGWEARAQACYQESEQVWPAQATAGLR